MSHSRQHGSEALDRVYIVVLTLISAAMLCLQIYPLFWRRSFYVDWINHVWIVSYYTDFIREHVGWPSTIDTLEHFGNPMPLFYGTYLYPVVSVLSLMTGADLAFRLFIALLLIGSWVANLIGLHSLSKSAPLSIAIATLANSSIYQLTNIYSRSALTEFCATEFLIVAVSLIFYASSGTRRKHNLAVVAGFACLTLALGSHPITFYLFALFSIPLILFSPRVFMNVALRHPLAVALSITAMILILSPWIYSLVFYHSQLEVFKENILSKKLFYFRTTIDSPAAKLLPFWVDSRVLFESIGRTSTPFLDAPFPVFFLGGFIVLVSAFLPYCALQIITRHVAPALATVAVLFYLVLPPSRSLQPGIFPGSSFLPLGSDWVHDLLVPIQFAYRLSNTFAIIVLLATFILLSQMRSRFLVVTMTGTRMTSLIALASLSLISVGIKTMTTYAEYRAYPEYARHVDPVITSSAFYGPEGLNRTILSDKYDDEIKDTRHYPERFYSYFDYAMQSRYDHVDTTEQRNKFELVVTVWNLDTAVKCQVACVISTNVIPSAFTRTALDGSSDVKPSVDQTGHLSIPVGPGEHLVSFHHLGRSLKIVSFCIDCLIIWVYGTLISGVFLLIRSVVRWYTNGASARVEHRAPDA